MKGDRVGEMLENLMLLIIAFGVVGLIVFVITFVLALVFIARVWRRVFSDKW
jgi:hypothetical protein